MSLINLCVNLNSFSIRIIEGSYAETKDKDNNIIKIFGEEVEIREIIDEISKKKNTVNIFNNIEEILKKFSYISTILILNDNFIKICTSIYHPTLRIFKTNKNEFFITEKEFLENNSLSKSSSFAKLFSHHAFFFHKGISNDACDFLTPASSLIFKKNSKNYTSDWYLNFEDFCSKSNHNEDAYEIGQSMTKTMTNFKNHKNFLSLSGGIDSALTLSASVKAGIDVNPVHLSDPTFDDETSTAINVTNYFKKKIQIYHNYTNSKFKIFNKNTNIEHLLFDMDQEMKGDSVKFPICNSSINLKHHLKNEEGYVHDGSSFPTTLTVKHWFSYPNRKNKIFDYNQNSELRYFDSKFFFDSQIKEGEFEDNWNLREKFPNINEYYWPLFDCFYTGNNFHLNHPKNNINKSFPLYNLIFDKKRMVEAISERGDLITSKIYNSYFFKKKLMEKNSLTAQILLKFIVFLNESCKAMHQNFSYSSKKLKFNTPGLNAETLIKLLSINIDEKLVQNAKWHIFKSFDNLSNIGFEKLFVYESLTDPKFLIKRSYQKIYNKLFGLIEFHQPYTFLNNKYFRQYLKKKEILEKYENLKTILSDKNLPNFPSDTDLADRKKVNQNLWLVNNIINITLKNEL